jgi:riboflavin kinase/FMN adenylyltransferase
MRVHYNISELPIFQRAVLTIGSFDGVHSGHRRILEQVHNIALQTGGESVVITFDPHPRTVIGELSNGFHLLTTTQEKIDLLLQTGINHVVVVPFTPKFAELSAKAYVEDFLIAKFNPHTIVIGYDHKFGNDRQGDLTFLAQYAEQGIFQIKEIPAQEIDDITVSSSKIRKALQQTNVEAANRLLSHPFTLTGEVVYGNQIGRRIGFPTANIKITDPYKLIPPIGIYAAYSIVKGQSQRIPSMLYIGERPTIEGASELRIEVNLLHFDGDLYEQQLQVEVIGYIRGDKKLDGLDALKSQIASDQITIEQKLGIRAVANTISDHSAEIFPDDSDVAIVILNYNTQAHLAHYLPSVVAYSGNARIIVADNGSPDSSMAFVSVHYPNIEIIDLKRNWGFAEGYNKALAQVKANFYIILNSDVEVTPGWTRPILNTMRQDPSIGVAQPKILADQKRNYFEHAGASGGWVDYLGYPFCRGRMFTYVEEDTGQYDDAQPCFWAAGAAYFIRADVYHNFGGFDGDYFAHNEEIDLCWRVKRAGYSVWCFPQSVVYHLGGGTLGYDSPRKVFLNFRNSLFTLLKNESATKLLWLIPARLVLDGVAAVMYLSKGNFAAIKALLQAHLSFYRGFMGMLKKRKQVALIVKNWALPGKKADKTGVYHASIVFAHYLRRAKIFSNLPFIRMPKQ